MAAAVDQRTHSPSPSRNTFGEKLSAIGSKLSRTFSNNDTLYSEERDSVAALNKERSLSRGRDVLQSTGRGGFGNIRQASLSRDRAPGPDDFSVTRGREPVANPTGGIYSTGRGGAGNLRSPSRDVSKGPDRVEKEVIDSYVASQQDAPVSIGRGGLGNINRSRSRDPTSVRVSTGRGGAGNIHNDEAGYGVNATDEVERKKHDVPSEGFHSTGRGGFANITERDEPAVERPSISVGESKSTGRGGAGNITRN
ncbi:hypothetical protein CC1G_12029 [Coprinopsis cinerea okayama7|uniref:Uncharacterized protein n=1 Tax=Coprinopsis cinerea (strain Okayama-7 / 130 / ATCC MYA-4618 / FGSC 9003) TaxID=240176 RepID=A8P8G9_COPC7|nr:hypothetical protein CC1G_12029 [Coprinopsis cinerea okayama7\|eukprot:XP_001839566.2 hypothetical protein CC1G_12029 [Coprinopsis cinerea okayama7\